MTNEYATKVLKRIQYGTTYPVYEALDMAIEALQQSCEKVAEGCDDYITIKRQFVLDAINIGLNGYISDDDKLTLEGMGIAVSEMPSAEPKTAESGSLDSEMPEIKSDRTTGGMIYRQDAIDAINRYGSVWMEYTEDMSVDEIAERALKASKQSMVKTLHVLPSAQPEQRWIPVSERLPEEDGNYLVTFQLLWLRPIEVCMFSNGQWDNGGYEKVLAWQPLPSPYQEES